MPAESDRFSEVFRRIYQHLVAQAPQTEAEWPPVATFDAFTSLRRRRPGWIVAAAAFLITSSFWVGWLIAPGRSTPAADQFQIRTETTAAAVPETTSTPYASPADAALAAALAQAPDRRRLRACGRPFGRSGLRSEISSRFAAPATYATLPLANCPDEPTSGPWKQGRCVVGLSPVAMYASRATTEDRQARDARNRLGAPSTRFRNFQVLLMVSPLALCGSPWRHIRDLSAARRQLP